VDEIKVTATPASCTARTWQSRRGGAQPPPRPSRAGPALPPASPTWTRCWRCWT